MPITKRVRYPLAVGLVGALLLTGLYFGVVSWAESPRHAAELFWEDRWIVFPIILGFGVQAGLYTLLKMRLFFPVATIGPSGLLIGVGGTTSTIAMAACCAHHVADVLPILGLTAATTFLAQYREAFMLVGLAINLVGITVMLIMIRNERRKLVNSIRAASVLESA